MKVTKQYLNKIGACSEWIEWVEQTGNFPGKEEMDSTNLLELLMEEDWLDWANWLIVRLMNKRQKVKYLVYAAEKVLDIFESRFPEAIEAARTYLKHPSSKTKTAARDAWGTASAAWDAASKARGAAWGNCMKEIIKFGISVLRGEKL